MKSEKEEAKSRRHKPRKPTESLIMCEICFDKANEGITIDSGHKIIHCEKCGIGVHRRCHGISNLPPEATLFTCDKCATKSKKEKACIICERTEGYLKKLEKGKWIHPICALFTDDVEIVDYYTMQLEIVRPITPQGTVPQCEYCESTSGQRLQCAHPACSKAAHAFCAFHHRTLNEGNGWQLDISLGASSSEPAYAEYKKYIEQEGQVEIHPSPKPVEETRVTRSSRRLAGSMQRPEPGETRQKNPILASRGGRIAIFCKVHRTPPVYCTCGGLKAKAKKEEGWMIACDYCDNWYHGECVGISQQQSEDIKVYMCDYCKAWENAKQEYMLDEVAGNYKHDVISRNTWEKPVYPTVTCKLIDIFLASHIYLLRGELLLSSLCNLGLLYTHLASSTELPIVLQKMQGRLKGKLENAIEYDREVAQEEVVSPLQIIGKDYNLIEDNLAKNEDLKQKMDKYIKGYNEEVKAWTKKADNIRNLQNVLETLGKIGSKFNTGMEPDEATEHLKILEGSGMPGFITEAQFLKDMLSEFQAWEARLSSEISLDKPMINEDEIFPTAGITEIGNKIQKIEEILKSKIKPEKINELLHEGTLPFINKTDTLNTLMKEHGLFKNWEQRHKDFLTSGATLDQFKSLIMEMCQGIAYSQRNVAILKDYDKFLRVSFAVKEFLGKGTLVDEFNGEVIKSDCTLEDLEAMMRTCEENTIKPLDSISALNNRWEEIQKWKEGYEDLKKQGANVRMLKDYLTKGERYKLLLPELENIRAHVEVLQSIESYTQSRESITYDYLCQLINKAISYNISDYVLTPLKSLLSRAQSLVQEAENLAAAESYDNIDEVYKCINTIKELRVTLPALDSLEKVTKSYEWFTSVWQRLGSNMEYSALESLPSEILSEVYESSKEIYPLVGPARDLQQKLAHVLWARKAKAMLDPTVKLTEKELSDLIEEMKAIDLDPMHAFYGDIAKLALDTYGRYCSIISEYEGLTKLDIDSVPEEDLTKLLEKARSLKQNAFMSQVQLSELIAKVHRIEQWINSYQVLLRLMKAKESAGIDPAAFLKAFETCAALQEGRSRVVEKVREQVEAYKSWLNKFDAYKKGKAGLIKEEEFSLEALKRMVQDATRIDFPLGNEVEMLKADIDQAERNEHFAKEVLGRLENINPEELESLIKKMQALPLYSKNILCTLKAHLWISQAKELLESKVSGQKRRLDDWNTLLKEREKILGAKTDNGSFKDLLKGELVDSVANVHREAMILIKQVNDLRRGENKQSFSSIDLTLLLDLLKKSIVDFKSEIEYCENMLQEAQNVEETLKILKKEKADYSKFEDLKKKAQKIPFGLGEVESELYTITEAGDELIQKIEVILADCNKRKSRPTESTILNIQREYSVLPCKIDEAEILKQKYEHSKASLAKTKEALENGKQITLDQISQVSSIIAELPIEMTESVKPVRLEICRKKYELFVLNYEKAEYKPTIGSLKGLLNEFNELEEDIDALDAEKIKHLELLVEDATDDIERIRRVLDLAELDKLEQELAKKMVDYSDALIEQRTRIKLKPLRGGIAGKRQRAENIEAGLIEKGYTIIKSKEDLDKAEEERKQKDVLRESARKSFEAIIRKNEGITKSGRRPEDLAKGVEEELIVQCKDVGTFYKERAEQVRRALDKMASYPLLSSYIGSGKLALWKLCKIRDSLTLAKKLEKIEGLLEKKKKKKKVEEDLLEPETVTSPRKNFRLNLLLGEDETARAEFSPTKYDPLQPVMPSSSTLLSQLHTYPEVTETVEQPRSEQKKEEDVESLESVEIAGGPKANFSEEEEEVPKLPPMREKGPIPYQPTLPQLPKGDRPYNPFETEVEKPKAGQAPVPKKSKQKSVLVPYSFDPTAEPEEPMPEAVPVGSLLKVWSGRIESGKIMFRCNMYTTDDIRDYYSAPALVSALEIDGRARINEVFQYLESNLATSKLLILKGWITPDENPESLENIYKYLSELEKTDKCGVIDVKEVASHLYLIPWNPRTQPYIQQWGINPINEIPQQPVRFAYFFAYKKRDSLGMYKPMRPTVIQAPQVPAYAPTGPEFAFTGVAEAEVLSEEEGMPMETAQRVQEPSAEDTITKTLKEKLATLSMEDIENLKAQLDDKNREAFERLLDEVFPGMYPSTAPLPYPQMVLPEVPPPMPSLQNIGEDPDYMRKVSNVQAFIDRNRQFFMQYAMEMQAQPPVTRYFKELRMNGRYGITDGEQARMGEGGQFL